MFYLLLNNCIMKNTTKIFIITIISLFLYAISSCGNKAEDCPDGAVIGKYFPAYPGSYWDYHNDEGTITNWTIGSDYRLFDDNCASYFSTSDCYIIDNKAKYSFQAIGTIAIDNIPIYYETIGKSGYAAMSFVTFEKDQAITGNVTRFRKTIGIKDIALDCLNIFNNTLIVKEFDTLTTNYFYLDYFAKDIGLVLREIVNIDTSGTMDTTRKLWLKRYNIKK